MEINLTVSFFLHVINRGTAHSLSSFSFNTPHLMSHCLAVCSVVLCTFWNRQNICMVKLHSLFWLNGLFIVSLLDVSSMYLLPPVSQLFHVYFMVCIHNIWRVLFGWQWLHRQYDTISPIQLFNHIGVAYLHYHTPQHQEWSISF